MRGLIRLQRGFSAIIVVVLLVLFGLIGVYMSTQSTTGLLSTTLSFNAMQAWFAARSGVEWGAFQALNPALPPGTGCSVFPGNFTIDGFSVNVQCNPSAEIKEGPDKYYIYQLTATAVKDAQGKITHVTRVINTNFTDAP